MTAPATLVSTPTILDCGAGGSSGPSVALTVPPNTSLIVAFSVLSLSRTTTSLKYNGVSFTPVVGSGGNDPVNSNNIAALTLASPPTGVSHTLAAVLSGVARGGYVLMFVRDNTGLGATNGEGDGWAQLSPTPADSSLICFCGVNLNDSSLVAAGPFLNNVATQNLSHGAGASSFVTICGTMRGYPQPPGILAANPSGALGCALEILSASNNPATLIRRTLSPFGTRAGSRQRW